MYLLDTDHLSLLQRGGAASLQLSLRLFTIPDDDVAVTIVSYEEQIRGWLAPLARNQSAVSLVAGYRDLSDTMAIYCGLTVLPFDAVAAAEYERLRKLLPRLGTQDLKIASIALANNATLLTRNRRDFEKVPTLLLDDWTI